jgi:hypothetical protein
MAVLLRALALALAALSATPEPTEAAPPGAASAAGASEDNDLYSFEYSYPPAAAAFPRLRAFLESERVAARGELIATARAERRSLAAEGIPYRAHDYTKTWQIVTNLPGWLSLSAVVSTFEGGAHPNHGFDALLWDKAAGVRRRPADLFALPALRRAVRGAFCAELDRQRRTKREGETFGEPGDWMNACIDPLADATLILGSSNRRGFDRLGFLIAPYAAGPYAEGDYEITLPVSAAVLAAVRPGFRSAFAPAR